MNWRSISIFAILTAAMFILAGCNSNKGNVGNLPFSPEQLTFDDVPGEVCQQDGKPIIRLFSTTWCPHCKWIIKTYDSQMKKLVDEGKIVAYHWELDTADDTLTPEKESEVPASELAVFKEFNPRGSIPTFVFGCKYYRIGNGYEAEGDLFKESQEFAYIIDQLILEVNKTVMPISNITSQANITDQANATNATNTTI